VHLERHRARRYSFHGSIELIDLRAEILTREPTSDLSLFGCHVDTLLPPETKSSRRSENFEALGKVTYARLNAGMGILFTRIEANDQSVLVRKC
jgi:hypothetical protein